MKQELDILKTRNKQLEMELLTRNGEITFARNKIYKLNDDNNHLRKSIHTETMAKFQKETEEAEAVKKELEQLKSELQFKDQEMKSFKSSISKRDVQPKDKTRSIPSQRTPLKSKSVFPQTPWPKTTDFSQKQATHKSKFNQSKKSRKSGAFPTQDSMIVDQNRFENSFDDFPTNTFPCESSFNSQLPIESDQMNARSRTSSAPVVVEDIKAIMTPPVIDSKTIGVNTDIQDSEYDKRDLFLEIEDCTTMFGRLMTHPKTNPLLLVSKADVDSALYQFHEGVVLRAISDPYQFKHLVNEVSIKFCTATLDGIIIYSVEYCIQVLLSLCIADPQCSIQICGDSGNLMILQDMLRAFEFLFTYLTNYEKIASIPYLHENLLELFFKFLLVLVQNAYTEDMHTRFVFLTDPNLFTYLESSVSPGKAELIAILTILVEGTPY